MMFDRLTMTEDEIVAACARTIAPIRAELERLTKDAAARAEERGHFLGEDVARMDALALRIADWKHTAARTLAAKVVDGVVFQHPVTMREMDELHWRLSALIEDVSGG